MNIFPVQQHAKIDFQRGLTGYESVNCESSALAQEPWSLCAFTSTISLSTSGTINLFSYCVYVGVCHRLAGWFKLSRVEAFLGEMTPACYWHPWLLSSEVKRAPYSSFVFTVCLRERLSRASVLSGWWRARRACVWRGVVPKVKSEWHTSKQSPQYLCKIVKKKQNKNKVILKGHSCK